MSGWSVIGPRGFRAGGWVFGFANLLACSRPTTVAIETSRPNAKPPPAPVLRSRDAAEGRGVYGQRGYEPRQLHTSCEQGDPVACNDLGYLIESGTQMQPDPALAARYYEKACAGTAWAGCNNLGLFLRSTQQGAPDPARGLKL